MSFLLPSPTSGEQLLKRTTSRCPVCRMPAPAEVLQIGKSPGRIFLRRTCPDHGSMSVCIASDARFYWLSKGHPANSACGCGENACRASDGAPVGTLGINAHFPPDHSFEKLSTCLALIEVVNSCNLPCPTCYAGSPLGTGREVDAPTLEDLQRRIEGVISRKGKIEILQLSGGEPTLHPRFFELLDWALSHPGIEYVLLNTNGVRIAGESDFFEKLSRSFRRGRLQLYLQFDGPQESGQLNLRGADLRAMRNRAIERCAAIRLPITLAMTVTRENLPCLWETVRFGLQWPHVRGVSFQPAFSSGRMPAPDSPYRKRPAATGESARINVADIILNAVEQANGNLQIEDFTPLPCGDPNCATIGYLLKIGGEIRSISEFVDFSEIQGFLQNKIRYQPEDLARCGCESEPLGELLKKFELDESHTFRLFIKPFMDAWSWDQDRIDRCCTHVIRPDGKLDSFCRYYSGFPDALAQR